MRRRFKIFMYTVKIKDDRMIVTCIYNDTIIEPAIFKAVFDTGAKYTVIRASSISDELHEERFENSEYKYLSGVVNGTIFKIYKVHLKQMTLHKIDIKEQDIWITFDNSVGNDILGMDVISKVAFYYDNKLQCMNVFEDISDLRHYIIDEDIKNLAAGIRN